MIRPLFLPMVLVTLLGRVAAAQSPPYNFDESKVGPFTMPDPLVLTSGAPVRNARDWTERRRPELMRIFETQVYGKTPAPPVKIRAGEVLEDGHALGGTA